MVREMYKEVRNCKEKALVNQYLQGLFLCPKNDVCPDSIYNVCLRQSATNDEFSFTISNREISTAFKRIL